MNVASYPLHVYPLTSCFSLLPLTCEVKQETLSDNLPETYMITIIKIWPKTLLIQFIIHAAFAEKHPLMQKPPDSLE